MDDTPYADAQSNFDCDVTKNSCPQIEPFYGADMPDLIENFMDYASEDCMNMFTQGQVALMRNVLTGPRVGLLESVSAGEPGQARLDWRLFPNPASESVTLEFSAGDHSEVRLLAADGRLLKIHRMPPGQMGMQRVELDLLGVPAGLYFVELRSGQGDSVRKLWLK